MDFKSKIKEAIEEGLKKYPEFLGKKQLVFFENKEIDYHKEREDVVEVYLESCNDGTYTVQICEVEHIISICFFIENALRQRKEDCLIKGGRHPIEDNVILITITE